MDKRTRKSNDPRAQTISTEDGVTRCFKKYDEQKATCLSTGSDKEKFCYKAEAAFALFVFIIILCVAAGLALCFFTLFFIRRAY